MRCERQGCRIPAAEFFREDVGRLTLVYALCAGHGDEFMGEWRMYVKFRCKMGDGPGRGPRRAARMLRDEAPKRVSAGEALVLSVMAE